jgi:hypothetical protein
MPVPNSAGKGLSRDELLELLTLVQHNLRRYDQINPAPATPQTRQHELNRLGVLKLRIEEELASPRTTALSFPRFAPPERCTPVTTVVCQINAEAELVGFCCKAIDGADSVVAAMAAGKLGYYNGMERLTREEGGSRA